MARFFFSYSPACLFNDFFRSSLLLLLPFLFFPSSHSASSERLRSRFWSEHSSDLFLLTRNLSGTTVNSGHWMVECDRVLDFQVSLSFSSSSSLPPFHCSDLTSDFIFLFDLLFSILWIRFSFAISHFLLFGSRIRSACVKMCSEAKIECVLDRTWRTWGCSYCPLHWRRIRFGKIYIYIYRRIQLFALIPWIYFIILFYFYLNRISDFFFLY